MLGLGQLFERTCPQKTFCRDVSVLNVSIELRLDPCRFRFLDGSG